MPKTKKKPSAVSAGVLAERLQELAAEAGRGRDAVHHLAEAAAGRHGVAEHGDRRRHHQGALEDVRVDAGHHAAGDAVEEEDGEAEPHPDRQADAEHRSGERPHRQQLGAEVADGADQDRHRRRARGLAAAIAGEHGVGDRIDLAHLGEQAQALGERPGEEGRGEADRQVDEQRREPHPVGQPGPAQKHEAAERRRHGGEPGDHHAEPLAGHPEVAGAAGAAQGPDAQPKADREIEERRGDDQRAAEGRHVSRLRRATAAGAVSLRDPPPAGRGGRRRRHRGGRDRGGGRGRGRRSSTPSPAAGRRRPVHLRAGSGRPPGRRPTTARGRRAARSNPPSPPRRAAPRPIRATGKVAPPNAASQGAAGEPRAKAASAAAAARASRIRAKRCTRRCSSRESPRFYPL